MSRPTRGERRSESWRLAAQARAWSPECWEFSEPTLRRHYREELDDATEWANALVGKSLFERALGDGPARSRRPFFWLKCLAGWRTSERDTLAKIPIVVTEYDVGG